MADVNEEIARLFFENRDFLVRTNVKYWVKGKKGIGGDSDVDLVAVNLHPDCINPPKNFILKTDDLKGIEYAAIEVKGWHTEAFTPSLIKAAPRIFNFIRPEADKKIKDVIQTAHYKKILVIPTLTKNEEKRKEAIKMLSQDGIDHIIEFETIIDDIYKMVEPNKNYNSEVLQTMRLLKIYKNHEDHPSANVR